MERASAPRLVESLGAKIEELESGFHRAFWESQIHATPQNDATRAELEIELRRVKGDRDAHAAVLAALDEDIHDPVLKRQLQVLRLSLTGNQMEDDERVRIVGLATAIESEFASFRPEIDGRRASENDIKEILRSENDEGRRRQAWAASKRVGAVVAERLQDLVRARNEVALRLGFADYYRMSLELQELSEEWLFDRLGELEELTDEPFRRWKGQLDDRLRQRFGRDRIDAWHYADPFFQDPPPDTDVDLDPLLGERDAAELAIATFGDWGIDIAGVIEKSDLYPRELKCQHAFCLDVDRSGSDVRILANVIPGEAWIGVMLHESGHAAYDISIDRHLPYLLRRATHTFVTEAIAILSGRLVRMPAWLKSYARVAESEVTVLADDLRRSNAAQSLQFARWGLVMTHFERALYADPEADLDATWWELVERFQMVPQPEDAPAGAWASKIHLAASPVYYHNYLLGEMLASQLTNAIEEACGALVASRSAGEFLVERVFRHGSLLRWDSLIEEATGSALSAAAFAADVAAA
ncbi:MAG TPA: M2 family metallopeptidase [Actinomycetota bacterium]|nr:M2 family metallopeptidase [Actinomycetota bacterium]